MSVQKIIQESIEKNPLGLKGAFLEELQGRIALALEAKMAMKNKDDGESEACEDDEVQESMRNIKRGHSLERLHHVGVPESPQGNDFVTVKTRTGVKVKVPKTQAQSMLNMGEELDLEENVIKYGKEYVENKIASGEWQLLHGSLKPGNVFTVRDMKSKKVIPMMLNGK